VSMLRGVSSLTLNWLPKVIDISLLIDVVPSMLVTNCGCGSIMVPPIVDVV